VHLIFHGSRLQVGIQGLEVIQRDGTGSRPIRNNGLSRIQPGAIAAGKKVQPGGMAKVSYQGAKMLPLGEETQQPASPGLPVHHRTKELTAEDPPAPGDRGGCVPDHGILQNAKHRALLQVIDSIDRRPRPRLPAIGIKRQVSPGMIPTGQCPGEQIQLIHGDRSGTVVFHHQPPEEQRLVRVNRGFQPQGNSMDILRLAVRRAFQAAVR